MVYEIHTTSKDHTEDEVRAGIVTAFPDAKIEAVKDAGDEWLVRLIRQADKPPFLDDSADDDSTEAPEGTPEDDAEDKSEGAPEDSPEDKKDESEGDDKGEKGKGDVVSELKDLMTQLQDVIKQVSDKAGEAVSETEEHRDKLDKAKDALGEEGGPAGLDDVLGPEGEGGPPAPPLPGGAKPAPVAPGGKKPFGGPKSVVPGRPGVPGGGPGLPAFTNVEVATHPGIDDKGARISLLAAAQSLESDPEFAEYEVVGMIENPDGSYSAKLKKKPE